MTDAITYQLLPELSPDEYEALKADIGEHGVLVPVEYDEEGNVLDGYHRVRACQELGIDNWPRVARMGLSEGEKRAHARKLNLARRHLNQAQKRDLIADQLRETPEWSDRRIARLLGVDGKTVGATRSDLEATAEIPQLTVRESADGKVRDTSNIGATPEPSRPVSLFVTSEREQEKAANLHRAARDGDEAAADLLDAAAAGRRTVSSASRSYTREKRRTIPSDAPPLPLGTYRTIVADPPWHFGNDIRGAAAHHYPTMPTSEIAALPVAERAADEAHLYLWTTHRHLEEAFLVARQWGFEFKTMLAWIKPHRHMGTGHYFRSAHEHVLFCARGNMPLRERGLPSWFMADRQSHSQKPEAFYELVEQASHGPMLELFARRARAGWDVWGDEVAENGDTPPGR